MSDDTSSDKSKSRRKFLTTATVVGSTLTLSGCLGIIGGSNNGKQNEDSQDQDTENTGSQTGDESNNGNNKDSKTDTGEDSDEENSGSDKERDDRSSTVKGKWTTRYYSKKNTSNVDSSIPQKPGKKWGHKLEKGTIPAPPVVKDDKVYIGVANSVKAHLIALSRKTGKVVWTKKGRKPVMDIAIHENTVVVGEYQGTITGYDAESGKKKWSKSGRRGLAPINIGKYVYTTFPQEKTIIAFNHRTGNKEWEFKADNTVLTPAESGDSLYIPTANKLYSVNASSGNKEWETKSSGKPQPVTVHKKSVLQPSKNGVVSVSKAGKVQWKAKADGNMIVEGPITTSKDKAFFTNQTNRLYSIDLKSREVKSISRSGTTPTAANKSLYVSNKDTLKKIDSTGKEKWKIKLSKGLMQPAVVGNSLYLTSSKKAYRLTP